MELRAGRVLIAAIALSLALGACAQQPSSTLILAAPTRIAQPLRFVTQGLPLRIEVTAESDMLEQLRGDTDADVVLFGDPAVYEEATSLGLITDVSAVADDEVVLVLPEGSSLESLAQVQDSALRIGYCSEVSSCSAVWKRVQSQFHESAEAESLSAHDLLDQLSNRELDAAIMFFSDATESSKGLRVLHFDSGLASITRVTVYAAVVKGTNLSKDAQELVGQILGTDYIAAFMGAGFLSA